MEVRVLRLCHGNQKNGTDRNYGKQPFYGACASFQDFPPSGRQRRAGPTKLSPAEASLISLYLNHKVIEFRGTLKQQLMRCPRRNADNISGRKLPPRAALNGAIALFMRRYGLSIHQSAADQQRRRTGLHEEDVSLGFVPLRLAIGLSVHQHRAVVGKISKQLHGKMVRIGGGINTQFLPILLE